ncbi:MAG: flagellar export chaperone FliS [bacterium]
MEDRKFQLVHGDPYRRYRVNAIETASPLMLVVMLYSEAIKMCEQALLDFGKNKESVHNKLIRAQKIVTELTVALNMDAGGELSQNLKSLYLYLHMRLVEANVENNREKVEEALRILRELREAWEHVTVEQRRDIVRRAGHLKPADE